MTVLALSAVIAVAEVTGALITGSLVLLADAAHMAADVSGIGLSLLAAHFAARPPTGRRTFGYARAEILAAMANGVLLLGMGGGLGRPRRRRSDRHRRGDRHHRIRPR